MNGQNDKIVVYHSEFDRMVDQWIWNGDGWIVIAVAALAIALVGGWARVMEWRDKKRRGY